MTLCLLAASALAAAAPATSAAVREFASRVHAAADNGRRPYAIVDKQAALLVVYAADGTAVGSTPVLLGAARGDASAPGVGERTQRGQLRAGDATTPAGRFESQPGRNHTGEAVVWVDFDAAFAIHRLRAGPSQRERARRLASTDPRARRVSAGCVVVPVAFYESIVQPLLGQHRGIVYVLPENGAWPALWDGIAQPAL